MKKLPAEVIVEIASHLPMSSKLNLAILPISNDWKHSVHVNWFSSGHDVLRKIIIKGDI